MLDLTGNFCVAANLGPRASVVEHAILEAR